ncbi:MAG: hypothetical protein A2X59_05725 [Nitrospirae bacterium GWC2_42_7]|nr:MAG: hypothetical protein A2X59_05725 [Nitrospirae bacterium GWC2_42_7]
MTKYNKGIIQAVVIVLSLVLVLVYLYFRVGQIKSINAEITKVRSEKLSLQAVEPESVDVEKIFPGKAGIALFVENLYEAARMSGIKDHEVSTVKMGDMPARRNLMKGKAAGNEKALKTYSLKISLQGNYRDTVEYIRELQNIERYKRIVELVMKPVDMQLKTDITVEIYSAGGQDAAQ